MKLTEANIRKAIRKGPTIKWLEAQPEEKRFAPSSTCACMYHDMLQEVFGEECVRPTYAKIEVSDEEVAINGNSFALKFQKAAALYAFQQQLQGINVPMTYGCRTISRDEAIAIAKEI